MKENKTKKLIREEAKTLFKTSSKRSLGNTNGSKEIMNWKELTNIISNSANKTLRKAKPPLSPRRRKALAKVFFGKTQGQTYMPQNEFWKNFQKNARRLWVDESGFKPQ